MVYVGLVYICTMRIQTEIALSTTETEYIAISQVMRDFLIFVSLMKEIGFVIKLQGDALKVLYSLLENLVTFQEEN